MAKYKKKLEEDIRCPLEYESESVDGCESRRVSRDLKRCPGS